MWYALKQLSRKTGKLVTLLKRPRARAALLGQRVAAALEHDAVLKSLRLAGIIDIGANKGQFSLAAREIFPQAVIVAFEPLPVAAATYRSVFASDPAVTLHQAAVSCQRGVLDLHLSKRLDSSSLLPISNLQSEIFPGTEEVGILGVPAGPLSDYVGVLPSPVLLKIDVQGFELEVLKASEDLLPHFDHIYVEVSFVPLYEGQALAAAVIAFLQEHNFVLIGAYNASFDASGIAIQADLLFDRIAAASGPERGRAKR